MFKPDHRSLQFSKPPPNLRHLKRLRRERHQTGIDNVQLLQRLVDAMEYMFVDRFHRSVFDAQDTAFRAKE